MAQPTPDPERRHARIPARAEGMRLDRFLAEYFSRWSRRQLAQVVKAGYVRVEGVKAKPGQIVHEGERLEVPVWSQIIPALEKERARTRGTGRTPSEVVELHRDEDLLVVAKPAGLAVHGGAGQRPGRTLVDAMREDVLAGFGLVHRLDRDTTGCIALVRGDEARKATAALFAEGGAVEKVYDAITSGVPEPDAGVIDAPLAPPGHRGTARVDLRRGRPARTRYRTPERFVRAAHLELEPETGRTHQIRVHLAHVGCPLLVDPTYGRRKGWRIPDPRGGRSAYLRRTPLHARRLALPHPRTGRRIEVEAPLPEDMAYALEVLRVIAARGRTRGGLPPLER